MALIGLVETHFWFGKLNFGSTKPLCELSNFGLTLPTIRSNFNIFGAISIINRILVIFWHLSVIVFFSYQKFLISFSQSNVSNQFGQKCGLVESKLDS